VKSMKFEVFLTPDQADEVTRDNLMSTITSSISLLGHFSDEDDAESREFVYYFIKTLEFFTTESEWNEFVEENKVKEYLGEGYKL